MALITCRRTFGFHGATTTVVVVAVFVGLSAAVVAVRALNVCTANITAYCIRAVVRLTLPWFGPGLNNVSTATGLAYHDNFFTGKARRAERVVAVLVAHVEAV